MQIKTLICALALAAPMAVHAQFDFGGGESGPAWSSFKLNTKTRVKPNFQNTGVDTIIAWYSKTSGITIIKDPALTGTLTIASAKPISLSDAFAMLNTTLGLKNYELRKDGNFLVIRQKGRDNGGGGNGGGGFDFSKIADAMSQSQSQLKVYTIQYANASQVARVVNEVFASAPNPMDQIMQMMGGGGFGNTGGFTRPGQNNGGRNGGNRGNFGGQGGNPFQRGNFGRGFGGSTTQVVRASSDDFSNSVIVNAPSKEQLQVENLIKQIDRQTDQPQQPRVFKLEFASSDDLAPVVQNVLTQNAPRGRGGIGTQNVPIEQRFQQALRFGGSQAAFGTVVSEPRTNSLVVTATEDNLKLVEQVVKELDTEIKVENTTFVFPLANARADQISQLMQQAFGTRTGTTNQNRNFNQANRNTTTNRNNQNRNNGGGGGGGGNTRPLGLNSENVDPNSMDLNVLDDGSLPTEVMVQQGGFGGQFFGGQNQRRTNTAQTGRDANGRLVNVRDLQGQITVIPDNNTNSVIVVATPENMEILKSILAQLDKIPEQVMIETMIIEATLDRSSQFGVEWKFAQSNPIGKNTGTGTSEGNFGLQNANPALQGFKYTLTGGALTGFINALQTDTKFQVLSTPRIFTSNNVEAQINISQSIPYVLSTREDSNGNLTFNYAFQDVGIVLTVTPRITANGYVTMDVTQTANDLQGFTDFNAPIVNQRQADTTVSVRDGETIILGGIIRNNVTSTVKKIPLLGDIPILGNLFRSTEKGNVKTELLVFLTPRVVKDPEEARKLRDEEFKRMSKESQKVIQPELNRNFDPDKDKKHSIPPDTTGKGGGN
jgi:general secretion pathway protein D